jgi:hypothetical protein
MVLRSGRTGLAKRGLLSTLLFLDGRDLVAI